MEAILIEKLWTAVLSGKWFELLFYWTFLYMVYREVRGMKLELHKLNTTVTKSFAEGEKRFDNIEKSVSDLGLLYSDLETRLVETQVFLDKQHDRVSNLENEMNLGGLV